MEYLTEWPPQERVDDLEAELVEEKSSVGEKSLKRSWSKYKCDEQSMLWLI